MRFAEHCQRCDSAKLNFVYVLLTCAWLTAWCQMGMLENAG